MPPSTLCVEPISGKKETKQFVMFPFTLYRDDPLWVPPLIGDRMHHFDPHHNPFFEHADIQLFRAVRDGEIVGVIAATMTAFTSRPGAKRSVIGASSSVSRTMPSPRRCSMPPVIGWPSAAARPCAAR